MDTLVKTCGICGLEKPHDEFNKSAGRQKFGLHRYCRPCQRGYVSRQKFIREYGITEEIYKEMLESQEHKCAACGQPETMVLAGKVKALAVDHDHENGQVRGLLCGTCNVALGMVKDSPARLRQLANYLERN